MALDFTHHRGDWVAVTKALLTNTTALLFDVIMYTCLIRIFINTLSVTQQIQCANYVYVKAKRQHYSEI